MMYVIAYAATALVFFGLDYLWLSRIAIGFYRRHIGELLLAAPNFAAAGLFYLFYVAGIVYFAVIPAVAGGNWLTAVAGGALLGLIAYGTYDMTNLATLRGWSIPVTVIDMAWGSFLTGIAATAGYLAVMRLAT
ncbi:MULTISPECIES: DUF2177 family protein [Alphaproteobacteria]|uniref:Membrane protein n=2 Tax=Alphaproteobacteria TaxID=28211 RepID=A0A512HIL9_9HYPH|nr:MULTISPECIES: DUF2177 family protein [Alphaproteobacteria]GEO85297.1 membrane protein [Ciceribacter naphthalenivorans]GLR20936.1 membrane protein [Ciceribacter naphthalenivorans]GLT03792.1 membrane protein [Sphingomonas psychrolutea]